ncbi:hypothetical protein GA0115255_123781, partial [Streptomyces sp. Ncost-T6T-2b]
MPRPRAVRNARAPGAARAGVSAKPSPGRSAAASPSSYPTATRPHGWTLLIDNAPQSHVDLDDPTHLSFAYQRR